MTATVVGAILDQSNASSDPDIKDVRKRIFGLSTVSGSSVAAAVITAALQDAQERGAPNQPPCKANVKDTAWFAASGSNSETTFLARLPAENAGGRSVVARARRLVLS